MRPLTFRSKTWMYVSVFTAMILAIAFVILGAAYYWFSLNSFKKDLVFSTREVITNQLVYENEQILFKKDNLGRTVSAYLRDENMSAVFIDANIKPYAAYGIYQTFKVEDLPNKIDLIKAKEVFDTNKPSFESRKLVADEEYFVLTMPVLFTGKKIGLIQMAMIQPLFSSIKKVGGYMLFGVIILGFIVSWPLAHMLVNFLFKPLDEIILAMEKARVTNLNVPLRYKGNPQDEISVLVASYNNLLARLADGFNKQKSFISNASHELKTPLARAISSIDARDYDQVKTDLFSFSKMIDELLLLSRIDSGAIELKTQEIDLREMIEEIENLNSEEIKTKKISIENKFEKETKLLGDRMYLKLILTNLISNSIKYSYAGGKIEVDYKDKALTIRDYGQGMSQNDYNHVFERFFRAAEAKKKTGFGVGMSLVKQLCEIHKIKIEYDKTVESGTKVILRW